MTSFQQKLKLKVDSYNSDPQIRDLSRIAYAYMLLESIEGKEQELASNILINGHLFIYAANRDEMFSMAKLIAGVLSEDDFQSFIKRMICHALIDGCHDKAQALLDEFLNGELFISHRNIEPITNETLIFIEKNKSRIELEPFIEMNYAVNKIGLEGHVKILSFVDCDKLKTFIAKDNFEKNDYSVLLTASLMGYLNDIMGQDLIDTILAIAMTNYLKKNFYSINRSDLFDQFTDGDILRIFCKGMSVVHKTSFLTEGLQLVFNYRNK